jgi:hypothetical protein
MERSKIRDTDNTRTFYLARFFIEYLLQHREADTKQKGVDKGESEALALGLVAEMAELDSVRFVFGRMRLTMDDRVRLCPTRTATLMSDPRSLQPGRSSKHAWIASLKS